MKKSEKILTSPLVGADEYSEYYEISSNGSIRSLRTGRVLSPNKISRSRKYQAVLLSVNGKQKVFYIHRLVAQAFLPNPENLPCVRHIDGNTENNDVSNLAWCTYSDNARRAYEEKANPHTLSLSGKPCLTCGRLTLAEDQRCPRCKQEEQAALNRMRTQLRRAQKVFDYGIQYAPPRVQAYAAERVKGKTYQEIADLFGVSRQCVCQALTRHYEKAGEPR